MKRLALLPVLPISGDGQATYRADLGPATSPQCVVASLGAHRRATGAASSSPGRRSSPTTRSPGTVARGTGRERPLVHVPLGSCTWRSPPFARIFGEAVFATWEEAELMEVPMVSAAGTADAEALGVEPLAVDAVLGA